MAAILWNVVKRTRSNKISWNQTPQQWSLFSWNLSTIIITERPQRVHSTECHSVPMPKMPHLCWAHLVYTRRPKQAYCTLIVSQIGNSMQREAEVIDRLNVPKEFLGPICLVRVAQSSSVCVQRPRIFVGSQRSVAWIRNYLLCPLPLPSPSPTYRPSCIQPFHWRIERTSLSIDSVFVWNKIEWEWIDITSKFTKKKKFTQIAHPLASWIVLSIGFDSLWKYRHWFLPNIVHFTVDKLRRQSNAATPNRYIVLMRRISIWNNSCVQRDVCESHIWQYRPVLVCRPVFDIWERHNNIVQIQRQTISHVSEVRKKKNEKRKNWDRTSKRYLKR